MIAPARQWFARRSKKFASGYAPELSEDEATQHLLAAARDEQNLSTIAEMYRRVQDGLDEAVLPTLGRLFREYVDDKRRVDPYESQRLGDKVVFRAPIPPSSPTVLGRFRNALNWSFERPDATVVKSHFGAVLSGEKLVDDPQFKTALIKEHGTAIGGEMEGGGCQGCPERWITHETDDFEA
jgi:hypothetical protein